MTKRTNKNPNLGATRTLAGANCLFCDADVPFGKLVKYNRTGLVGAICECCEADVFAEPSTLWTLIDPATI